MSHPLSDFKYCPHCGAARFEENDACSKRCASCGFTFYPNAAAATVAAVIDPQGRLLCITRAHDPGKGTLDLPGGFVDPGECLEDGLIREVSEELGACVTACRYLFSLPNTYLYSGHLVRSADAFFLCRLRSLDDIHAGDDAASLHWIPLPEVPADEFGMHSVGQGVRRLQQMWAEGQDLSV